MRQGFMNAAEALLTWARCMAFCQYWHYYVLQAVKLASTSCNKWQPLTTCLDEVRCMSMNSDLNVDTKDRGMGQGRYMQVPKVNLAAFAIQDHCTMTNCASAASRTWRTSLSAVSAWYRIKNSWKVAHALTHKQKEYTEHTCLTNTRRYGSTAHCGTSPPYKQCW